jgi:hypothetical protein
MAPGKIVVEILQVFFEFFQSNALRHVVRVFLQVPEPHIIVSPVDEPDLFHVDTIPLAIHAFNAGFGRPPFACFASFAGTPSGLHRGQRPLL